MANTSRSTHLNDDDNVRQRLIDAAIEELCDRTYPVLDGIQVARVAHRANVPERTARRHFKSDELKRAAVEKLCDPEYSHPNSFGVEEFRYLEQLISDRSLGFAETLDRLLEWMVDHNKADHRTNAVLALAAHGLHDDHLADALSNLYQVQAASTHAIVEEFTATHRAVVTPRTDWITPYELGLVAFVLVEGFALHARIREANGRRSTGFDPNLVGRAFRAICASAFIVDGQDVNWVDQFYQTIDAARRAGTAGSDANKGAKLPTN